MLKGAIIGFGKIAQSNHLAAFRSPGIKERLRIVAVVEPNPANLERSRREHPEFRFYQSMSGLLQNESIDFVDITCPPKMHCHVLETCIEHNLHVICEKPFTLNLREAELLRPKLLDSSLTFMPCHQYKYSPIWKQFKSMSDMVKHSSRLLLQFNVFRMAADPGLGGLSNPWRTALPENGGGILLDTGIHYLYLLYWMFGRPGKVSARLSNLFHVNYQCEDTALITLEFERAIAQITVTWAADKRYNDARMVFDSGSIFYEGRNKIIRSLDGIEEEIPVPDASDKEHYSSLYGEMFGEFADAVENNQPNVGLIEEAYQSIKILSRCRKAASTDSVA